MSWNGKDEMSGDVLERGFTLQVDNRAVPGVYWAPAEQVARLLVGRGIAAMAIDGPEHGERRQATKDLDNTLDAFSQMWHQGGARKL